MRNSNEVRRLKLNGEEFGIAPELAWLMQAQPLWDEIKRVCVEINRNGNAALDPPLDRLRFDLLVLASLLGERRA